MFYKVLNHLAEQVYQALAVVGSHTAYAADADLVHAARTGVIQLVFWQSLQQCADTPAGYDISVTEREESLLDGGAAAELGMVLGHAGLLAYDGLVVHI